MSRYIDRQIDGQINRQKSINLAKKKKLLLNVDTAWLKLSGKNVVSPKKNMTNVFLPHKRI